MLVMKFGAAAIGEAAQLRDLAQIVKISADEGEAVIVVCTALAGITDALINAARQAASAGAAVDFARRELWSRHRVLAEKLVGDEWEREALYNEWAALLKTFDRLTRSVAILGELSPRSIDAVAALGERFMAHLVAVVLRRSGVAAQMIDATELIVTDAHFGGARPHLNETVERTRARLRPLMAARIVPVITGYIGATSDGVVTTLGRGGGDYSATLIGAALEADEVCLWTDVDGIMTADPKIVPQARTLPELSFAEASEIAALGAEVLHPHTLAPVAERGITLHIRNLLRPNHIGTRVVTRPKPTTQLARAIISARGLSLLSVAARSDTQDWGAALSRMAASNVEILSFTQSLSEHSLTLAVRAADAAFARDCIATIAGQSKISLITPVALVAIVSTLDNTAVMPRALASLGRSEAHLLSLVQSANAAHLSLLLPESEVDHVVRALHADLGLA